MANLTQAGGHPAQQAIVQVAASGSDRVKERGDGWDQPSLLGGPNHADSARQRQFQPLRRLSRLPVVQDHP
jgi:hypothetical protein